tara:strand:- start:52 stop:1407 length:1356 start_codon:yes stop_codon:yes gene_type:complete
MAYEPSEGLYAGLSLLPTSDLNEAKSGGQKFLDLYNTAVNMLKESGDIKEKGTATRNGLVAALDLTKLTEKKVSEVYDDLAGAISAVLATRKDVNNSVPETVYLTGNKWHKDVEEFKVDAFGMSDYNSSDLILYYSPNQYVGISLKKKRKADAPSPTMINNAFSKFITGPEFLELRKKLDKERKRFFATQIKKAATGKGPLANYARITGNKSITQLKPETSDADAQTLWSMRVVTTKTKKVKNAIVNEVVPLINLKDEDTILTEGSAAANVPDKSADSAFRKMVNSSLVSTGGKLNPLYQSFYDAMNVEEVKDKLADTLLARVLKTKLLNLLDWEKNEFGFYVVEGVGNFNQSTNNAIISNASVYDIHTIMCAIAMLAKKDASIEIDTAKTYKAGSKAAKVYFILSKGDTPILDIQLRYKGSFTAMPQFFATMTKDFQALMKEGGCSEIFN